MVVKTVRADKDELRRCVRGTGRSRPAVERLRRVRCRWTERADGGMSVVLEETNLAGSEFL